MCVVLLLRRNICARISRLQWGNSLYLWPRVPVECSRLPTLLQVWKDHDLRHRRANILCVDDISSSDISSTVLFGFWNRYEKNVNVTLYLHDVHTRKGTNLWCHRRNSRIWNPLLRKITDWWWGEFNGVQKMCNVYLYPISSRISRELARDIAGQWSMSLCALTSASMKNNVTLGCWVTAAKIRAAYSFLCFMRLLQHLRSHSVHVYKTLLGLYKVLVQTASWLSRRRTAQYHKTDNAVFYRECLLKKTIPRTCWRGERVSGRFDWFIDKLTL